MRLTAEATAFIPIVLILLNDKGHQLHIVGCAPG